MKYQEWQIGTGLAYPFCCCSALNVVPYAGFKLSWANLDMDDASFSIPSTSSQFTLFDVENKLHWGFPFGFSVILCDVIGIAVEGRFGDEQAINVNGQFRF